MLRVILLIVSVSCPRAACTLRSSSVLYASSAVLSDVPGRLFCSFLFSSFPPSHPRSFTPLSAPPPPLAPVNHSLLLGIRITAFSCGSHSISTCCIAVALCSSLPPSSSLCRHFRAQCVTRVVGSICLCPVQGCYRFCFIKGVKICLYDVVGLFPPV